MILLKELIHSTAKENETGMIHIDSWRLPEVDYLHNMGFIFEDDFKMSTPKPPIITIYKKKDNPDDKKSLEKFYLEEPNKSVKTFNEFRDIISFFDSYEQEEIDKRK